MGDDFFTGAANEGRFLSPGRILTRRLSNQYEKYCVQRACTNI
jgi:hypothetical protein